MHRRYFASFEIRRSEDKVEWDEIEVTEARYVYYCMKYGTDANILFENNQVTSPKEWESRMSEWFNYRLLRGRIEENEQ